MYAAGVAVEAMLRAFRGLRGLPFDDRHDLQKLFAESGMAVSGGNWRPDPARLGAGVLTGIGFLGAGTIMRHENIIRGVTTAAGIWLTSASLRNR